MEIRSLIKQLKGIPVEQRKYAQGTVAPERKIQHLLGSGRKPVWRSRGRKGVAPRTGMDRAPEKSPPCMLRVELHPPKNSSVDILTPRVSEGDLEIRTLRT